MIYNHLKPVLSGLAIIPLIEIVPQVASQEDSLPELSFDGLQVPAEFDRDIDDTNVTNDASFPRNIFFNPDAGYIGKKRRFCDFRVEKTAGVVKTRDTHA